MRCVKCGTENPAGKRFCGDCGAALANRCAQCGADNPAEKKFYAVAQSGWMVLETFSISHGKASAYLPVISRCARIAAIRSGIRWQQEFSDGL